MTTLSASQASILATFTAQANGGSGGDVPGNTPASAAATSSERCYSALGFLRTPFSIVPDTSLFFPNGQHVSAYNELRFAMQGGVMAVLTGEVGLGKTLISRFLLRNSPTNVKVALLTNPLLSYSDILATVFHDFTGRTPWNADSLVQTHAQLMNYALECAEHGIYLVVIVDEAQKLSAEALEGLRLLSNLETEKRKLISLVLIGQPEFERTLALSAMRPLRERIGVWCKLRSITRHECTSYIAHRLTLTRTSGNVHFSSAALFFIHHYTRGVPRRINLLCDRALLLAFALGKERIGWSMVRRAAKDLSLRGAR